jgi:hypothetical protein
MSELKRALMHRDELSSEEADEVISEMQRQVANGADPEDVLYDEGLEPDYLFDLI